MVIPKKRTYLTVKSGPAQLAFPKLMSPAKRINSGINDRDCEDSGKLEKLTHGHSGSTRKTQGQALACWHCETIQRDGGALHCSGDIFMRAALAVTLSQMFTKKSPSLPDSELMVAEHAALAIVAVARRRTE